MKIRIFFDLDGVLADMEAGLKANSELNQLRLDLDNLIENKFTEYKGIVDDDIKSKFKAELEINPDSPVKELKKAFNKYTSKVFSVASKNGFYRNLPLMPGAKEMVSFAAEITGDLPHILSSPVGDENNPDNPSVLEKREWVERHFSGMIDRVIITSDKGKVVESNLDILIDDRPKYVEKFTLAGGQAILHTDYKKTIQELRSLIEKNESKKWVMNFDSFRKAK
jgi:5'(3')-deoxyribonucleotidase